MTTGVTVIEALQDALELIESLGYRSGDIHDGLRLVMNTLRTKYPEIAKEEL